MKIAILAGEPIQVFNYGKHWRDFTYVDDIVESIIRTLDLPAPANPQWDSNQPDRALAWRLGAPTTSATTSRGS
jgi:UDP-glucuronate 4-epimerase